MLEIYTDGASRGNPGPSAYAFIFVYDKKIIKLKSGLINFATNNIAEYTAIFEALKEAKNDGYSEISVLSDSMLTISQLNGVYKIKSENLKNLHKKVIEIANSFDKITFTHTPRGNQYIKIVDYLCTLILGPK